MTISPRESECPRAQDEETSDRSRAVRGTGDSRIHIGGRRGVPGRGNAATIGAGAVRMARKGPLRKGLWCQIMLTRRLHPKIELPLPPYAAELC